MTPIKGSVIQFAPDTTGAYVVDFDHSTPTDTPGKPEVERWAEPLIGWAVVVTYVDDDVYETEVQPIVLDQGSPATMYDCQAFHTCGDEMLFWTVRRADQPAPGATP